MDKELREKIKEILVQRNKVLLKYGQNPTAEYSTDQILALIKQEYVRLAKDQTLPNNPYRLAIRIETGWEETTRELKKTIYSECQQDMKEAGWKKLEGE